MPASGTVRTAVAILGIVLFALVVLDGCSSSDDDGSSPTPSSTTRAPTTNPAPTPTVQPCEPGGRSMTLQGVRVRQFCGPAVVTVQAGDETLQFMGGECARHEDWLSLNIGFEIIDSDPGDALIDPEFRAFTLLMGRHPLAAADAVPVAADGVFTEAVLTFAVPGQSYIVDDKTVTLVGTRIAGVFSGTGFRGIGHDQSIPISGTFTCDTAAIPLEEVRNVVETVGTGP